MTYQPDSRGRLSGVCLLDMATILAIMITAERLKVQTEKDRESMALWDCEHRFAYTLTSGNTLWTIFRELASQHHKPECITSMLKHSLLQETGLKTAVRWMGKYRCYAELCLVKTGRFAGLK